MYGNLDKIRIITVAPEIEGALDTIKELKKRGIIVSIGKRIYVIGWTRFENRLIIQNYVSGHSQADISIAEKAVKNGASLITHLFNAMTPVISMIFSLSSRAGKI